MGNRSYEKSARLLERAKKVLAGGVSSEFRKYGYPHALFYTHGRGSRIFDADRNAYIDFTLSQGPLILGHAHDEVHQAVAEYVSSGQLFAGQHMRELELAEKISSLIPAAEMMRFCLDGSEAVQTALRVARAKTGRQKFLRFEGHYHGWLDNVCWGISAPSADAAGLREAPEVFPWTDGIAGNTRDEVIVIPWNDAALLEKTMAKHAHELAAVITEPVMCNNGCILPQKGYLETMQQLCRQNNMAFILDEVITGFRMGLGGAQQYFGLSPDLCIFAKAIASGYPISVIAGKKEWMEQLESGRVIQAGTMNSSNATVAAAMATIRILEREMPYGRLFRLGNRLMEGIRQWARKYQNDVLLSGPGPMFQVYFTDQKEITDYRGTLNCDKAKLGRFIAAMHDEGIRIIGRGLWYISTAHTDDDIDMAIEKAGAVLKNLD